MIVREVLAEDMLTYAEVKNILSKVKKGRSKDEGELPYGMRRVIEHVETFAKIDAKSARKLVGELSKLDKVRPDIAVRIADIMPQSNDEVRSIYAKERFTLNNKELEEILDIVGKYIK